MKGREEKVKREGGGKEKEKVVCGIQLASFPGPCLASRHLQYGKAGEGLVRTFPHMSDIMGRKTVERL